MTTSPDSPPPASASKALLVYNALRLGLLAAALLLGYVAGLRGFLLVVAALLVSGVLSWFVLRRQRIRASVAVEQAVNRSQTSQRALGPFKRRRAAAKARIAAEDAYADEVRHRRIAEQALAARRSEARAREAAADDARERSLDDAR